MSSKIPSAGSPSSHFDWHTLRSCLASLAFVLLSNIYVNADLVAHLNFDDSGDLGADSSGNGNHGTQHNSPLYSAIGISGGAADLTGGTGTFRWTGATNPVQAVLQGDFTFSVWVNTTATGGGAGSGLAYLGQGIVYADVAGNAPDATPIALNSSQMASLISGSSMLSSTSINTGNWMHLVVTRQVLGSDHIYINGNLEGTVSDTGPTDLSARNELVLGGNLVDSRYFAGMLDDFQVYDSPLSASQVGFLYNNPGLTVAAVPEPSSFMLAAIASMSYYFRRRSRFRVDC